MCLVCIINAEEARIQKSNLIDGEINALKDSDLTRFFSTPIFSIFPLLTFLFKARKFKGTLLKAATIP